MIQTISRYYLLEFARLFGILAAGLGAISSIVELVDKIEGFVKYNPPPSLLLLYAVLNIPRYLAYLMPLAALVAGLFVFGIAGRRRELVAIKASGGSIKRLLIPFVSAGLLLSIAAFLVGEFVTPACSQQAHRISDAITKRNAVRTFKEGAAWLRSNDYTVKIDLTLPEQGALRGVTILRVEDDLLTEHTVAESGRWESVWGAPADRNERSIWGEGAPRSGNGVWVLRDVVQYDLKTGVTRRLGELYTDIIDPPDTLRKGMQKPEEMNVRELLAYTKRLKEAGMRNTKLIIDIHARLSYPLINLVMLVLGVSLATREELKSGLVTTAIGIAVALLYWLGYTAALSLGYMGILPPFAAPWLVPLAFGGIAAYLFHSIPE